ncbi:hypothetical protein HDU67_002823 [Dinochytrium kinnereticum]|nr:hypothetical protein HDU67_002823 [Dinochytrium kinnereticum]
MQGDKLNAMTFTQSRGDWRRLSELRAKEIREFLLLEDLCKNASSSSRSTFESKAAIRSMKSPEINFSRSSEVSQKGVQTDILEPPELGNEFRIPELEHQLRELQIAKASWALKEQRLLSSLDQYRIEMQSHNEVCEKLKRVESELKQLRRDNLIAEKNKKASDLLPSKRERAEIDILRKKLLDVSTEQKDADFRHSLTVDRLNKRNEMLRVENEELKEEVKLLERERVANISHSNLSMVESEKKISKADSEENSTQRALDDFQLRVGLGKEVVVDVSESSGAASNQL